MAADQAKYGIGQYGSAKYGEVPVTVEAPAYRNEDGAVYGLATYGTDSYGSGSVTVTHTGVEARGNLDYAGAANNAWWLPDMGNYSVVVTGFNGATEVFADGVSLGSTSGAGNTLTITQAQYADKLITTDKPADFSYPDGRANAIPTSWAGTEFITRSTRYGSYYKIWSISGTATVQIFKDGTLDTTAKITNGTQYDKSFADDASDPEYRIKSDLPILVFESGNSAGGQDSNPLFPSTSDDLYGVGSSSTYYFRDEGYGSTGVSVTEYRSNGGSTTNSVSTTASFAGTSGDFVPPASRIVSSVKGGAESLADGDGGESIRFVPAGAMAHEFILGELAEFVGFVGEPGTVGRYIRVYNSSGTLIDTVQLDGDGGENFPSYAQIISASTTDSALTGNAKSYNLSAGTKFVSDVPVMGIQEDDSSNDEHNFFGLRHFAGFVTGEAVVVLPSVQASGTADPDIVIEADATHTLTSVQGTGATGTVGTVGVAIHQVDGVQATGQTTTTTVSGDSSTGTTGVEGTGQTTTLTISADANTTLDDVSSTGSVTTVTLSGDSNLTLPSTSATGQITTAEGKAGARGIVTGVEATGEIEPVVAFTGIFVAFEVDSVEATGAVTTATVVAESQVDPTGVQATGTADDGLTFVGEANVVPESSDATGSVTTATVTADSNTTAPSVQATGTADPDVVIEADANHVITSVQGVGATGGVGDVVAEANVDTVDGVSATIVTNTVSISAEAGITPESAEGTGAVTTTTVTADANFTPESADATGAVTTVDISIPKDVAVPAVTATGDVETVTLSGIARIDTESASATANVDPDIVIEADANHVITSVQGVGATGGVGDVVAEANVDAVIGVEATGLVEPVTVSIAQIVDAPSVSATATVNDVIVANFILVPSVQVSGQVSTVSITGEASLTASDVTSDGEVAPPTVTADNVLELTSVSATPAVNTSTISATVFDYQAQKDNYSKKRTVYLPRAA